MISALCQKSKFEFWTLTKKNKFLGFHGVVSTREDLSIDVSIYSITNVGLISDMMISTKLKWFQLFVKSQILNFKLFWKKKIEFSIFGFPCCSTRDDLPIDASTTNVGLILTKLWWFLFSGSRGADRQTYRHGFDSLTWKHVGTQKISQLKAQN